MDEVMSAGSESANAMRLPANSSVSATPWARPTATTSAMRSCRKARVCGFERTGPSVLRMLVVVADSPTRNTYFSQIERRTSVLSSAVTPDFTSAACRSFTRFDTLPSYSPTTMRCIVPVWWIVPGFEMCVAT